MGSFKYTDFNFPWDICNYAGVQGALIEAATKGAGIAKGLAAQHVDTGQLLAGIGVASDVVVKGKGVPVQDWLVTFAREDLEEIEYGGLRGVDSMYNRDGGRARWVPGLRIVHRTFNAMGG